MKTKTDDNEWISALLNKYYEPADFDTHQLHLTTLEVYNNLQRAYPSDIYSPEDVASIMRDSGFQLHDFGEMHFEWLLKQKNNYGQKVPAISSR